MRRGILLLSHALALAPACSSNSDIGPSRVIEVRVVPDSVSVAAGDTVRVEAFPLDADTAFLPQVKVTWASQAAAVASVDGVGLITGVGSGSTQVEATAHGVVGTVKVIVP